MRLWDDDAGDWRNLSAATQVPRYDALARIISTFCPGGSILDVGCGEAILLNFLPKSTVYLGVEPSRMAAASARLRCGQDCIVNLAAEDFDAAHRQWDCIVFNEVLYYTSAPLRLVRKYARLLRPGGIMVVSIFQRPEPALRRRLLWWAWPGAIPNIRCSQVVHDFMITEDWSIELDEFIAKPESRHCWRIFVAKPSDLRTRKNSTIT